MRSLGCSMYKGLPVFKAGGVTARAHASFRADESNNNSNRKTALTPSFFSNNHFSSSLGDAEDPMLRRTRVTVKVIEGKDLLVSDLPTGTSDPVVLLWVGSCQEGDIDLRKDKRVQSTEVRKHTVDPVWDAEFTFPLEVESVEDVLTGRVNFLVRDHDDADGDVHYLDLGRASIALETVLTEGNIMAHTQMVQLPARWYPLQRCRGMKKARGILKISVGFCVGPDSTLLRDEEGDGAVMENRSDAGLTSAARFERNVRNIRGARGATSGAWRTASISPSRRSPVASRTLTARGGTTCQRPQSAPEAATLTSPVRVARQGRPFELQPIQAPFPPAADIYHGAATTNAHDPHSIGLVEAENNMSDSAPGTETTTAVSKQKPRWRDKYRSPERQRGENATAARTRLGGKMSGVHLGREKEAFIGEGRPSPTKKWVVESPPAMAQHVRSSAKLSRLAAKAARGGTGDDGRGLPPDVSTSWGEKEGATMRAHRWERKLLESMQRLEERSTGVLAYGELRAMAREATSPQVARIVAAACGVGTSCSLAARRFTLRLLAWICWDQPRAASKIYGGIVTYALERVRDEESASLRGDLAVCVGAVMLSALRRGPADACMIQTRRFLELAGEQRMSVRESAGTCCVAAVLPPPPLIPVEIETGLRSMDDVRLAIGQAAGRAGISNVVPKEAVLLPGGRAVVELADAPTAAEFFDRISIAREGLPSSWSVCPFPEEFCAEAAHAEVAHFTRLTVNSEEILASLLETLDTTRSEGTRAPLLDAMAAMARSYTRRDNGDVSETATRAEHVVSDAAESGSWGAGLAATLKKGLPAVARAVAAILECPERRAYTWRERKAALGVIANLAVLPDLRGPEGPLGEHRAKLIRASTRGKHDSVAAVRGAAGRALEVLEASQTDAGTGRMLGSSGSVFSVGGGRGRGTETMSVAEMRRSYRAGERERRGQHRRKAKNLDGVVSRAEREAAQDDASGRAAHHREDPKGCTNTTARGGGGQEGEVTRQTADEQAADIPQEATLASPVPSLSSAEEQASPRPSPGSEQRSKGGGQKAPPPLLSMSRKSLSSLPSEGASSGIHDGDRRKSSPPETPLTPESDVEDRRRLDDNDDVAERAPRRKERGRKDRVEGGVPPVRNARAKAQEMPQQKEEGEEYLPSRREETKQPFLKHASVQDIVAVDDTAELRSAVAQLPSSSPPVPLEPPAVLVSVQAASTRVEIEDSKPPAEQEEGPFARGKATAKGSPLLPPRIDGGLQMDTIRLLTHLKNKTDGIAGVLSTVNHRLGGMERSLEESQHPADASPNQSLSRKHKKRPRPPGRTVVAGSQTALMPQNPRPNVAVAISPKATSRAAVSSSNTMTRMLRRDLELLAQRGDVEGAFRLAIKSGSERDVLRLMGSAAHTGSPEACQRQLGMETRDRLFAFVARVISAGRYVEHVLPWVFGLVKAGEARSLPLAIRMQLAGSLHGLAASPNDQGVLAARLGPYFSLASVGRLSLADEAEAEGGQAFRTDVAGGT